MSWWGLFGHNSLCVLLGVTNPLSLTAFLIFSVWFVFIFFSLSHYFSFTLSPSHISVSRFLFVSLSLSAFFRSHSVFCYLSLFVAILHFWYSVFFLSLLLPSYSVYLCLSFALFVSLTTSPPISFSLSSPSRFFLTGFWTYSQIVCQSVASGRLNHSYSAKIRWTHMILSAASWNLPSTDVLWSHRRLCCLKAS